MTSLLIRGRLRRSSEVPVVEKSTIVNLIPRLYDVTEGSITLDGIDIRELSMKDLRQQIGFVPQKGVLFSGTIASNLRFGKRRSNRMPR